MITLPNGCSCSKLSVNPKNWQAKNARVSNDWYITYRFYDPNYPKPKLIMVKGMNNLKTLADRQEETKKALSNEYDKLLKEAYNPFKFVKKVPTEDLSFGASDGDLSKDTPLVEALTKAYERVTVTDITRRDLKWLITHIAKAVKGKPIETLPIANVTRKIVKKILEIISSTPDRFNKNRSYLMILFSELCEQEAVDLNPLRDIKKKKVIKHVRKVLSPEERKEVDGYLQKKYPAFHNFLHIFFHSGARISELLRLKGSDVDMRNQRFKIVILKGRQYKEVWRTIKDIALPYWDSAMRTCQKDDFVFSKGLEPGIMQIKPYQIGKRWYRLVKKKLNIDADFYSLKHLHTTEVVDMLDEQAAAKHNEHTSTAMVIGIYDVQRDTRQHNKVKSLRNKFA